MRSKKLGRIGGGSFDALAGSLNTMFNFSHGDDQSGPLFLDPTTGEPVHH
jgi:phospholipase C